MVSSETRVDALLQERLQSLISCACVVTSVEIVEADKGRHTYRGRVTFGDRFESGVRVTREWAAEPSATVHEASQNCRGYLMRVYATESYFGKGRFCVHEQVDRDLQRHIVRVLASYNPSLPSVKVRRNGRGRAR